MSTDFHAHNKVKNTIDFEHFDLLLAQQLMNEDKRAAYVTQTGSCILPLTVYF